MFLEGRAQQGFTAVSRGVVQLAGCGCLDPQKWSRWLELSFGDSWLDFKSSEKYPVSFLV
jgi:hypothetical protein